MLSTKTATAPPAAKDVGMLQGECDRGEAQCIPLIIL